MNEHELHGNSLKLQNEMHVFYYHKWNSILDRIIICLWLLHKLFLWSLSHYFFCTFLPCQLQSFFLCTEMGSPNFQSNKDVAILNITGDESSLSDPIYDAVPVRCRQINGQYFSSFANANHKIIALCLQCTASIFPSF